MWFYSLLVLLDSVYIFQHAQNQQIVQKLRDTIAGAIGISVSGQVSPGSIVAAGLADLTLQHQLGNLTSKMEEQNNVSTAQVKKEQEKDVASFLPNL